MSTSFLRHTYTYQNVHMMDVIELKDDLPYCASREGYLTIVVAESEVIYRASSIIDEPCYSMLYKIFQYPGLTSMI